MTSTEKFLDILAERDLLPDKLVASLRQQVAKASKPIRPDALAKRLIEAGHLTPTLAKRLLAALPQTESAERARGPAPSTKPKQKAVTPKEKAPPATVEQEWDDDDLGLAPLDEEDTRKPASASKVAKPPASGSPSSAGQRPKASAPAKPKEPEPPPPGTSLLDEELLSPDPAGGGLSSMDGLLAAGGMEAAAAGSPLMPVATKRRGLFGWLKRGRRAAGPQRREKVWDSPVLLLSGGVLLGLVVVGAVLLWALRRQSGDEVLAAANEDYRAGSYTQAIHKYDQYLRRFPGHQGTSSARVKRGLAHLRQAVLESGNWPAALATAQQVVQEISPEEAFGEAGGELAAMLPAIAEGLAARAQENNDPELLAQAHAALELASNRMMVPTRLQPTAKLEEIEGQLGLIQRQIRQGAELDAAIAAIENALVQGDAALAYKTRQELLRTYPALADDPKLMAATQAISAVQKSAVQATEQAIRSHAEQPVSSVSATVTLAERTTKETVSGAESDVFVTVVGGAAYGFDANDGRLIWERFLGDAPDGLRAPVVATAAPDGDVFVLAPPLEELWRLDARTGRPQWRLPLGEPVDVSPVLVDGQLLVATRGGRLHVIDAESGNSVRHIQLPQPLPVAPAVDIERGLIYQAADHSNLFVLELGSGRCVEVVHLGHAQGSLGAAPVVAANVLLVPVNDRARTAVLRVYGIAGGQQAAAPSGDSEDAPPDPHLLRLLQEFRVRGQFDTPPVVAGLNTVALTDLGALYAYELSAADPDKPLVPILQRETTDTEPLVRYCLFPPAQIYLADSRLTKFDLRAAEGRLAPQWVSDERSAFLEPPRAVGNAVVHVRRRVGEPGVIVAAVHTEDGRMLWQNRIAVPPADRPIVGAGREQVVAVNSAGSLFQLDIEAIRDEAVFDEPAIETEQFRQPVSTVVDLGDGAVLLSSGSGSDQLAVFNPVDQPGRYIWRMLPGKLTCPPASFQNGVVLPCLPGHVFLLDPHTNEPVAEPFQPPLGPESRLHWQMPAIGGGGHLAITDGQATLFVLAIESAPKPHFTSVATVKLALPIIAPLAAAGDVVFAVNKAGRVAAYELPELGKRGEWALDSPCTWGPVRVGDFVLLATEAGKLLCFDAAAKLCWRLTLPEVPLAGATVLDGHLLLATANGTLLRIDSADGREVGRIELHRSLATDPVPVGQEVLIVGDSGNLYRVKVPAATGGDRSP